jgi:hypothetical protein
MARFKVGDPGLFEGRLAKVVWVSENANEIEPIDEYIVELEDKGRRFATSSALSPKKSQPLHNRKHKGDACRGEAY